MLDLLGVQVARVMWKKDGGKKQAKRREKKEATIKKDGERRKTHKEQVKTKRGAWY